MVATTWAQIVKRGVGHAGSRGTLEQLDDLDASAIQLGCSRSPHCAPGSVPASNARRWRSMASSVFTGTSQVIFGGAGYEH
jgi:hypothetical protein